MPTSLAFSRQPTTRSFNACRYDREALLRMHKMADFKKLSGVLDYPSTILLTMVVAVFTIFFPFLVIFVTGGVLLEMQANILGLLGFSRVSIFESSGDGRWTWMILWTQCVVVCVSPMSRVCCCCCCFYCCCCYCCCCCCCCCRLGCVGFFVCLVC